MPQHTHKALSIHTIPARSNKSCWDGPWAQRGPCPGCGPHTHGSAAKAHRDPTQRGTATAAPDSRAHSTGHDTCAGLEMREPAGTGHRDTGTSGHRDSARSPTPRGTRGRGQGPEARSQEEEEEEQEEKERGEAGRAATSRLRGLVLRLIRRAGAGGSARLGPARPAGKRGSQGATHTGTAQAGAARNAATTGHGHTPMYSLSFFPVYSRDTHGKQPRSCDSRPAREARLLPRLPVRPELPAPYRHFFKTNY